MDENFKRLLVRTIVLERIIVLNPCWINGYSAQNLRYRLKRRGGGGEGG